MPPAGPARGPSPDPTRFGGRAKAALALALLGLLLAAWTPAALLLAVAGTWLGWRTLRRGGPSTASLALLALVMGATGVLICSLRIVVWVGAALGEKGPPPELLDRIAAEQGFEDGQALLEAAEAARERLEEAPQ